MAKTVGIGIQSFDKVITGNYFYIDKTEFIKEWWESETSVIAGRPKYEMQFTNYEVKRMFSYMIHDWFDEPDGNYNAFVEALLQGDKKAMNCYMNRVALQTFSYFDTGKNYTVILKTMV